MSKWSAAIGKHNTIEFTYEGKVRLVTLQTAQVSDTERQSLVDQVNGKSESNDPCQAQGNEWWLEGQEERPDEAARRPRRRRQPA